MIPIGKNVTGMLSVRFRAADSVAVLRGLIETEEEGLVPFEVRAASTGADSLVTMMQPLPLGKLVCCECVIVSGTDYFGCATMSFGLYTMATSSSQRVATILYGLIGEASHVCYPVTEIPSGWNVQGIPWTRAGAAPGAGNDFDLTLSGYFYKRVIAVKFRITTDATAATRQMKVYTSSDGANYQYFVSDIVVSASKVYDVVFTPQGSDAFEMGTYIQVPIPEFGVIDGGEIGVECDNFQAGDTLTNILIMGEEVGSLES